MSAATWSIWPHRADPPHKQVVAIVPGRGATAGALIVSPDDVGSDDLDRHARLIAAAPDLLSALAELMDAFDASPDDLDAIEYVAIVADAKSRARAAITKATGQ